jgi:hypothetical protein
VRSKPAEDLVEGLPEVWIYGGQCIGDLFQTGPAVGVRFFPARVNYPDVRDSEGGILGELF